MKQENIEEGLVASRRNGNKYLIVTTLIFLIASFAAYEGLTSLPFVLYENQYNCKGTNSTRFDTLCDKSFVCNKTNILGQDYFSAETRRSLISDLEIYCDSGKIQSFYFGFYFACLLIIITPGLIKLLGVLLLLKLSLLSILVSNIFMYAFTNFYVFIICYSFNILIMNVAFISFPIYLIEITEPKKRYLFMGLCVSYVGLSGLLVNLIFQLTQNYRAIYLFAIIFSAISTLLMHFFLVEPVRTNFLRGKIEEVYHSLEYIAKRNNSFEEFILWKNKIQTINASYLEESTEPDELTSLQQTENNMLKEKFKQTNIFNIWELKSIRGLLILFSLTSITNGLNLPFFQLELRYQTNLVLSNYLAYIFEIIGYFFGCVLVEWPFLKRKWGFVFVNVLCFISSILGLFFKDRLILLLFNRFNNAAFYSVHIIFSYEIFPTMVRAESATCLRLISRLLLLSAPLILISRNLTYFTLALLCMTSTLLICILNVKETYQTVLQELPDEYLKEKQ